MKYCKGTQSIYSFHISVCKKNKLHFQAFDFIIRVDNPEDLQATTRGKQRAQSPLLVLRKAQNPLTQFDRPTHNSDFQHNSLIYTKQCHVCFLHATVGQTLHHYASCPIAQLSVAVNVCKKHEQNDIPSQLKESD